MRYLLKWQLDMLIEAWETIGRAVSTGEQEIIDYYKMLRSEIK